MRAYERRYHAAWVEPSALMKLGTWMTQRQALVAAAPHDLLFAAAADVAARLPRVAAREPTQRHRKHFTWLLGWQLRITAALKGTST